jgi:hypothetical protein
LWFAKRRARTQNYKQTFGEGERDSNVRRRGNAIVQNSATSPAFRGNNHDCVLWNTKRNQATRQTKGFPKEGLEKLVRDPAGRRSHRCNRYLMNTRGQDRVVSTSSQRCYDDRGEINRSSTGVYSRKSQFSLQLNTNFFSTRCATTRRTGPVVVRDGSNSF